MKQCMVVALTRTVGKHYKAQRGSETACAASQALPELDDFLLRILDMSIPLLDAEWGAQGSREACEAWHFTCPEVWNCH